uniref:Uncharacterized protein n=1 Tax=Arundo donax TaxID=35708 RepID=A0A0A9AUT3_ARUDO
MTRNNISAQLKLIHLRKPLVLINFGQVDSSQPFPFRYQCTMPISGFVAVCKPIVSA